MGDRVAVLLGVEGVPCTLPIPHLVQLCSLECPVLHTLHSMNGGCAGDSDCAVMIFSSAPAADRALQLLRSYPLGPTTWLQARLADKGDFKRLLEPLLDCLPAARLQLGVLAASRTRAAHAQPQPSTHIAIPAQQLPSAAGPEGPMQPPPLAQHNPVHPAQLPLSLPSSGSSPPLLPPHLLHGGAAPGHAASLSPYLTTAPAGLSQQPSTHAVRLSQLPPHLQGLGLEATEYLHSPSASAGQHAGPQRTHHPGDLSTPYQPQAHQPQPLPPPQQQAEQQPQQLPFPPAFGGGQGLQPGSTPAPPSSALPAQQAGEALRLKQMLFLAQQKQEQQHHSQASASASLSSPPALPTGSSTQQPAAPPAPSPAAATPKPSQEHQSSPALRPGAAASAAAAASAGSWEAPAWEVEQGQEPGGLGALTEAGSLRTGARPDGDWGDDEQAFVTVSGRGGKPTSPRSIVGDAKGQGRKLFVRPVLESLNSKQVEKVFARWVVWQAARNNPYRRRFGALEEVVKFPEATYAFVSYLHASAAAAAVEALHGMTLKSLTGNEPLLIDYRKLKGAAGGSSGNRDMGASLHASSSGSSSSEGGFMSLPAELPPRGAFEGRRMLDDATPGVVTTKLWVANIHRNASRQDVEKAFSRFGPVWDVMLAQGSDSLNEFGQWAFVNFKYKADAGRAFWELADRVVPALTKSKCTLKLKFKVPNKGC